MRLILGIILFLFFFLLAGFGVHYLMYDRFGLFIWTVENGAVTQTKLDVAGPTVSGHQPTNSDEKARIVDDTGVSPIKGKTSKANPKVKNPNLHSLFNGKNLDNWEATQFGGEGEVYVNDDGDLEFEYGEVMTGVHWIGEAPKTSNYEISLEAMRLNGSDFFCALTFPVKDSHASLIVGGWGGSVVGISSIDGLNANENETLKIEGYETEVWYKIKLRVTDEKIQVWIDDKPMVDVTITNREISLRPGAIEISVPIGLASYQTGSKYRNIFWENLSPEH